MLKTEAGDIIGSGDEPQLERFLLREDVKRATGLATSTIYELMSKGEFPAPIRISPRRVAWREREIIAWQQQRISDSGDVQEA